MQGFKLIHFVFLKEIYDGHNLSHGFYLFSYCYFHSLRLGYLFEALAVYDKSSLHYDGRGFDGQAHNSFHYYYLHNIAIITGFSHGILYHNY